MAKLAVNDALREYVQDRLAGAVTKLDGTHLAGPGVRWIGRRHGRRQDRRWAMSWSPEQIAHRLPPGAYRSEVHASTGKTREGLALAQQTDARQNIREGYLMFSTLYDKRKQTDSAYSYYRRYIAIKDSVLNDQMKGKFAFELPVNPGGGLIGDGHPVGATGVRQVFEAYQHLTEQAGARQIPNAKRYLTFNMGGSLTTSVAMLWGRD